MKKVQDSRQLNNLVKKYLSKNRGHGVSRLVETADFVCVVKADGFSSHVRWVFDAAFMLAQKSGSKPVYRIILDNPRLDAYFIGPKPRVTAQLKHILGKHNAPDY